MFLPLGPFSCREKMEGDLPPSSLMRNVSAGRDKSTSDSESLGLAHLMDISLIALQKEKSNSNAFRGGMNPPSRASLMVAVQMVKTFTSSPLALSLS